MLRCQTVTSSDRVFLQERLGRLVKVKLGVEASDVALGIGCECLMFVGCSCCYGQPAPGYSNDGSSLQGFALSHLLTSDCLMTGVFGSHTTVQHCL